MKNNQTYVLVEHKKGNKQYLFKLKKGIKASIGDFAVCETIRDEAVGTIKEIIKIPSILESSLVQQYGAYQPLQEVIFVIPETIYEIIWRKANTALSRIHYYLSETCKNLTAIAPDFEDLPF